MGDRNDRRQPGVARTAPQRRCAVCRVVADKRDLHRVVRRPDGVVEYDPTGKAPGRGAYLCAGGVCVEQAIRRGSIAPALKTADPAQADAAVLALRSALRRHHEEVTT